MYIVKRIRTVVFHSFVRCKTSSVWPVAFTDDKWKGSTDLKPSVDQQLAFRLAMGTKYLFISGPAGTGKSHVLNRIYQHFTGLGKKVLVTASTGSAAQNMNGRTFQHTFGFHGTRVSRLLRMVDVLILDEVSILSAAILAAFDKTARDVRRCDEPFGGIHMLLCGDFLQLPNVSSADAPIFESALFIDNFALFALRTNHRIFTEYATFRQALEKLRLGIVSKTLVSILRENAGRPSEASEKAVHLFPKCIDALRKNTVELAQLGGQAVRFPPVNTGLQLGSEWTKSVVFSVPNNNCSKVQSSAQVRAVIVKRLALQWPVRCATEDVLVLRKLGTQNATYFCHVHTKGDGKLRFTSEKIRQQMFDFLRKSVAEMGAEVRSDAMPMVHECVAASITLPEREDAYDLNLCVGARVMLTKNLTENLVNGALGTVETFVPAADGGYRVSSSHIYKHVPAYEEALRKSDAGMPLLPVVRFDNGQTAQIPPIEERLGESSESAFYFYGVLRIPLALGYAFTIHKVQGLTLSGPVVVELENIFRAPHLAYVALSRVRSPKQLIVRGFDKIQVFTCKKAMSFEKRLEQETDDLIEKHA